MSLPYPINDGSWHHVQLRLGPGDAQLTLDYGQRSFSGPTSAKIQGLPINKIVIGGPDSSEGIFNVGQGYFEGCIQVKTHV